MKRGNMFWGFVLILVGVLFYLKTAGVITDVWGWFWPVGMIMLGVWVLVMRFNPGLFGLKHENFSVDLQGATRIDVDFDHGAGTVFFGGGAAPGVAISGLGGLGLEVSTSRDGDRLGIDLEAGPTFLPFLGPDGGEWRFALSQEVPVAIKIDAGASSMDLDLRDVKLTFLGINTGASSVRAKLPANAGQSLVDIESGAATIELQVPAGVGARIRFEQGASSINVDEKRFPRSLAGDHLYQSVDYDSCANKMEISLDGGANTVKIF